MVYTFLLNLIRPTNYVLFLKGCISVVAVVGNSGSMAFDQTSEGGEMCEPCLEEVPDSSKHSEEIESSGCHPKDEEALVADTSTLNCDNVESGVYHGDDPSSNGQPLLKQPKDMLKRDS